MYGDEKRTRIISQTGLFIALIAIGSYITIPMIPVPITLQSLFVLLCGCIMKRYAAIAVSLYIILGLLGLPVFHQFTSGPGILFGPTGGYLVGFIFAALITGFFYEKKNKFFRISGLFLGTAAIIICGVFWMAFSTGITIFDAVLIGAFPFIIGDLIKITLAFFIFERVEDNYD
ncbi:MAG: biotin transporter BioY [Methanomicrobiaceae archaeon]|nr:biotin transporter BioY [Methanomicrobiaceae archaeon]